MRTDSTTNGAFVPLRATPQQEDANDAQRIALVVDRWRAQDAAYSGYARMIEEHIRMLSGRQWDVYSEILGRFVDVLQYMSEDERKTRQRPQMDWLGFWFLSTMSKATENPPIVSFLPATADHTDATLAEVLDPVWKTLEDEMDLADADVRALAWALVAGQAYYLSRADFAAGPARQLIGPAVLSLTGDDGSVIERVAEAVPYDQQGTPLGTLVPTDDGDYGFDVTGEPYTDREGAPKVDVLCPLEVRAQWGQHIAWKDKQWIIHRWFLTPDQVEERFGVRCDPDATPAGDDQGPGYLERMLFGAGYFGTANGALGDGGTGLGTGGTGTGASGRQGDGFVCGYTLWEKPCRYTPEAEGQHGGGRLLVVAPGASKVLWDSPRPVAYEAAGPIRPLQFLWIPGRQFATTILEKLVPLQKRLNRVEAQVAEHTNLVTNPILLRHQAAGLQDDEFVARPGVILTHNFNGAGRPAEWLVPPPLSNDVWRHKQDVRDHLFVIGGLNNASAANDAAQLASGELVSQLRFDTDRPLAPLLRSLVRARADVATDVVALLPTIWTEEKLLTYAGDDNVPRVVVVQPEMWTGRVNVRPVTESAMAESRAARLQRVTQLYQLGAWGPPGSPQAIDMLLKLSKFPDLTRAMRPGGMDRVTAEHNLGRLLRGEPAASIALLPMYDLGVHLAVTEDFMKSPEYLGQNTPLAVQHEIAVHRETILAAQQAQLVQQAERQAQAAGIAATAQAQVQGAARQAAIASGALPPDGPTSSAPPGGPPPGTGPATDPGAVPPPTPEGAADRAA